MAEQLESGISLSLKNPAQPTVAAVEQLKSLKILSLAETGGFGEFEWDIRSVNDEMLPRLTLTMFHEAGFIDEYQLPLDKLCHFVLSIAAGYHAENPYHNWRHAFSVARYCFLITRKVNLSSFLSRSELFTLFVACLCHDIDHRARTSAFLKLTNDPIVQVHPTSILENHHFNYTKALLGQEAGNILVNQPAATQEEFLGLIKSVIIATDLGNHFKSRGQFRQLADNPSSYDKANSQHRALLIDAVMTCCDLCAVSLPISISETVVYSVFEEFFVQSEEELRLGFTPSPDNTRGASVPKLQRDFIDVIPAVAYKNLVDFFPELRSLYDHCMAGRKYWDERVV